MMSDLGFTLCLTSFPHSSARYNLGFATGTGFLFQTAGSKSSSAHWQFSGAGFSLMWHFGLLFGHFFTCRAIKRKRTTTNKPPAISKRMLVVSYSASSTFSDFLAARTTLLLPVTLQGFRKQKYGNFLRHLW